MNRPRIEPRSPGPLADNLLIRYIALGVAIIVVRNEIDVPSSNLA